MIMSCASAGSQRLDSTDLADNVCIRFSCLSLSVSGVGYFSSEAHIRGIAHLLESSDGYQNYSVYLKYHHFFEILPLCIVGRGYFLCLWNKIYFRKVNCRLRLCIRESFWQRCFRFQRASLRVKESSDYCRCQYWSTYCLTDDSGSSVAGLRAKITSVSRFKGQRKCNVMEAVLHRSVTTCKRTYKIYALMRTCILFCLYTSKPLYQHELDAPANLKMLSCQRVCGTCLWGVVAHWYIRRLSPEGSWVRIPL